MRRRRSISCFFNYAGMGQSVQWSFPYFWIKRKKEFSNGNQKGRKSSLPLSLQLAQSEGQEIFPYSDSLFTKYGNPIPHVQGKDPYERVDLDQVQMPIQGKSHDVGWIFDISPYIVSPYESTLHEWNTTSFPWKNPSSLLNKLDGQVYRKQAMKALRV